MGSLENQRACRTEDTMIELHRLNGELFLLNSDMIETVESTLEILSCKYEYHNLKVLVKEHILKEKFDSMYCMLDESGIETFRELALKNDEG